MQNHVRCGYPHCIANFLRNTDWFGPTGATNKKSFMHTGINNEICSCSWQYSGNLILWITSSSFTINSVTYVTYFCYQADKCSASTLSDQCWTITGVYSHAFALGSRGLKFWLWSLSTWELTALMQLSLLTTIVKIIIFLTSLTLPDNVCIISE